MVRGAELRQFNPMKNYFCEPAPAVVFSEFLQREIMSPFVAFLLRKPGKRPASKRTILHRKPDLKIASGEGPNQADLALDFSAPSFGFG